MFELHVIKDIASWRYGDRTAVLSKHRSQAGAQRAMMDRVRSHSLMASAYEIHEVAA